MFKNSPRDAAHAVALEEMKIGGFHSEIGQRADVSRIDAQSHIDADVDARCLRRYIGCWEATMFQDFVDGEDAMKTGFRVLARPASMRLLPLVGKRHWRRRPRAGLWRLHDPGRKKYVHYGPSGTVPPPHGLLSTFDAITQTGFQSRTLSTQLTSH